MRYLLDDNLATTLASNGPFSPIRATRLFAELRKTIREQDMINGKVDRAAFVKVARNEYVTDEVEIDDEPELSPSEDGCWVAAWVWVSNEDIK